MTKARPLDIIESESETSDEENKNQKYLNPDFNLPIYLAKQQQEEMEEK